MLKNILYLSMAVACLASTACSKREDAASKNLDGTCTQAFVDAYNETKAANSYLSTRLGWAQNYSDVATAASEARAKCDSFASVHGTSLSCEAQNTLTGSNMQASAASVKADCDALKSAASLLQEKDQRRKDEIERERKRRDGRSRKEDGSCTDSFASMIRLIDSNVKDAKDSLDLYRGDSSIALRYFRLAKDNCETFMLYHGEATSCRMNYKEVYVSDVKFTCRQVDESIERLTGIRR